MELIICIKCGEERERSKSSTSNICHECWKQYKREYVKEYRKDNPEWREAHRINTQKYRLEHPDYRDNRRKKDATNAKKYRTKPGWKDKHKVWTKLRRFRMRANGGSLSESEWKYVCEKYGNVCLSCGKKGDYKSLTVDHIVPVVMGGTGDIYNVQPLCKSCNSKKSAKTIDYRKYAVHKTQLEFDLNDYDPS